jgi:hypothetical protein
MGYVFSTRAGLLTLFALGIEAVVGLILAASNGLSELHKDVLVWFSVAFPLLILLLLLTALRGQAGVTSPE